MGTPCWSWLRVALWVAVTLAVVSVPVRAVKADEPMPMGADMSRLEQPPMPENPTQADHGAYEYWLRCMACHGDRGQGLTDEWRAAWGGEEQNCWQSKCHAANHPPEGFKLPEFVPQVIGDDTLARFETAADLHDFVCARMPWHAPGSLDDAACWQLTSFLLRANEIRSSEAVIGPENARMILLARASTEVERVDSRRSLAIILPRAGSRTLGVVLLLGIAGVVGLAWWRARVHRDV